jgi:hypothetical protein
MVRGGVDGYAVAAEVGDGTDVLICVQIKY